jgi:tRNA nucleotidyltransferase/poly(A) polymerase
MNLVDLLLLIGTTAKQHGITMPLLCGGTPRDKVMGRANQLNDLDFTTGDEGSLTLPKLLQPVLPEAHLKTLDDGHSQLTLDGLKLDFSTNFVVPGIEKFLVENGLSNPTSMQKELYSRDFTCNALLLSLDLKELQDPTGLGIKDIQKKLLRTCLPASITLSVDHKRVVRVLYLAAKLNFEVDAEIIKWVKENPETIKDCKPQYLSRKLQEALDLNLEKTLSIIDKCGLWSYLPPVPQLVPYLNKPGRL